MQLSPGQVGALKGIGLSLGDYAAYTVALTLASVVLCLVVSTLIVWRRSDDRMALLVALLLVTFGPIIATSSVRRLPLAGAERMSHFLADLARARLLLFPSGQFVPRWMRWTFVVLLGGGPHVFFPDVPFTPNTSS